MSRMLQIIRTTVTSSLNGVISRQLVKQNVHEQTGKRWSSSLTVKNLKGKRAVITGSTSGIGLGIAEKLAAGTIVIISPYSNDDTKRDAT
jgi:hypothetical protein